MIRLLPWALVVVLFCSSFIALVPAQTTAPLTCTTVGPLNQPICHPPTGVNFGVGPANHFDASSGTTGFMPVYNSGGGAKTACGPNGGPQPCVTVVSHSADARFRVVTATTKSNWVQLAFANKPLPYGEPPSCFVSSHTPGTGLMQIDATTQIVRIWWQSSLPRVYLSAFCVGF